MLNIFQGSYQNSKENPQKDKEQTQGLYTDRIYKLPSAAPWELLANKTLGLFVGCTKLRASCD